MTNKPRVQPIRSTEIRKVNERLLLNLLHERGPQSQTDLATQTGLQASTVFRIFADLEERGIIQESEPQQPEEAKKGRKPLYYALNPASGYVVGVDLATGQAAILLVDFTGQAVREAIVPLVGVLDGREAIGLLTRAILDLLKRAKVDTGHLLGVGIGAPGVVDIEEGTVVYYARFPGMEGVAIRDIISDALGVPVLLHNNASVLALSEYRYGRAQGVSSLVAFLFRAGVGGAYLNNGTIFTSQGRTTFEAGHMFLNMTNGSGGEPAGPASLEDCFSEESLLDCVSQAQPDCDSLEDMIKRIEQQDPAVCQALERRAEVLLQVVRNIALLLNPEAYLIITRFRALSNYFVGVLDRRLHSLPGAERFHIGSVIGVEYDPIIACKGAAHLVFDRYFHPT